MTQTASGSCCGITAETDSTMTVERYVRLIAGVVVLLSVAAGYWLSPWFLAITALMGLNLLQSAFTNWCPAMPVLRSLGVKDA